MEKAKELYLREENITSADVSSMDVKAGTIEDRAAMRRLGKEQLFKVRRFMMV